MIFWMSGPFGVPGLLVFWGSIAVLLNLVALIALVALIYFWVQPGTVGPNQYGPDPKAAPGT